jgi:colanic acid biosynthesis glycosyl transferase WcaI
LAIRARIRDGFEFVALHAGNLGHSVDFVALADAARGLDPGIGIVMVGAGARREELQRSAADIPNLRFLDYFPASELRHVLEAGDIHIVSIKPGLEGLVVPSKLYSSLSAGRPVLAAAPATSDVAVIVGAERCGVVIEPSNSGAIAHAISELAGDPARLKAMGEASSNASVKYARDRELAKLVELVEKVAETGDSAKNREVN